MITAEHLTKRFGSKTAVDDVSFTVRSGAVTGFLGPNGAGKSTTMRMILGLDRPTSGHVSVDGQNYATMPAPLTRVGALLDAKGVHPGRTARSHLRAVAATHGIGKARVDEVIEATGLSTVAGRRAGTFSLGMGQRLGLATALLGDPSTFILDEPVNGLDPEGVRWVRQFVRRRASEGRTVLLSSHLMSEMAVTADHVIVIGRGKILADSPIPAMVQQWTTSSVSVRTPQVAELASTLAATGVSVSVTGPDTAQISGLTAEDVARIAAERGIALYELTTLSGSLEDAYLALTGESVEYKAKEMA